MINECLTLEQPKDEVLKYKVVKVFDCQEMTEDVQESFWRIFEGFGNDVYVYYQVKNEVFRPEELESQWAQDKKKLDDWLVKNGAVREMKPGWGGEDVLIKHWW